MKAVWLGETTMCATSIILLGRLLNINLKKKIMKIFIRKIKWDLPRAHKYLQSNMPLQLSYHLDKAGLKPLGLHSPNYIINQAR